MQARSRRAIIPQKMSKRKASVAPQDPRDILSVTPLGAGNEVGRSCIVLKYKGKTIMV